MAISGKEATEASEQTVKRCQTKGCQSKATNGFDYCVPCITKLLEEKRNA